METNQGMGEKEPRHLQRGLAANEAVSLRPMRTLCLVSATDSLEDTHPMQRHRRPGGGADVLHVDGLPSRL